MKRCVPAVLALVLSATLMLGQGSLTPPGAPAATMKSLDQVEPRTAISSAGYTITQPGSYYLTSNLAVTSGSGIVINANDVTVDLNGFNISSSANGTTGIFINSVKHVVVRNGSIVGEVTYSGGSFGGNGFGQGILVPDPSTTRSFQTCMSLVVRARVFISGEVMPA